MSKLIQLVLLIFWGVIANGVFLEVTAVPKQLLLEAGVSPYKFLWISVQLVWCYLGYMMLAFLKHKYWNFSAGRH